jgi:hypothetical protein
MAEKNLHPDTAKIELAVPMKISGVEVKHVILRRPKVRDRVAAQKAASHEADQTLHLVASLTEIPIEDLMEMDGSDFNRIENQVAAFLSARP